MTNEAHLTFEIRIAWWVRPYLRALGFFAWLHAAEPDWTKVERVVLRGMRVRLSRQNQQSTEQEVTT